MRKRPRTLPSAPDKAPYLDRDAAAAWLVERGLTHITSAWLRRAVTRR